MSDDEDVICKGRDLYSHLIDQGYSDFETFTPTAAKIETSKSSHPHLVNTTCEVNVESLSYQTRKCITISSNYSEKLGLVINSKLLFKEDVDLIESALEDCHINKAKSKWFWYTSALAGLMSSLVFGVRGTKFHLPCGFAVMFAIYSLWKSCKETAEEKKSDKLRYHINILQSLCLNVQKLLRLLKETEILSGSKGLLQNECATIYKPVTSYRRCINNLNSDLSCLSLPHIRKRLLQSLIEVVHTFTFACNVLKQISPDVADDNAYYSEPQILDDTNNPDMFMSLKHLQLLNENYLAIQSIYLRLISFNLCPKLFNSFLKLRNNSFDVFELCNSLESTLSNVSFRLKMQYEVHKIFSFPNKSEGMKSKLSKVDYNETSNMQIEVHNIFLLILALLLRVKNVEDYLEKVSNNLDYNQSEIIADVCKKLSTLKDDHISTLKCFDRIHNQFASTLGHQDNNIKPGKNSEYVCPDDVTTKKTGIVVGASDFNVNSPDEVFLAISGLNNEEQENVDDFFFENKPQIPHSLLSELSIRLKMRHKYFSEREKAALERQGLLDFTETPDKRSGSHEETGLNSKSKNQTITESSSDISDSSDYEGSCLKKIPYQQMKQSKRYQVDSDSNGSETDDEKTEKDGSSGNLPIVNRVSLANQVAMKSQLWRNTSEEFFSDG